MPLIDLSIIVPFYNEEECIGAMYKSIVDALDPLNITYEILFVDDGSHDNTFTTARKLALQDQKLRVIKFRKNYGQTPAMTSGIDHARGKILITMDGDLQNDPVDIPLFLDKIDEGYDIVVGWRYKRQDNLITRKIPSRIANWLIGKVTGVPIKDNGCSLKAYRAEIIKNVPLYSEMHRFIPAMLSLTGAKIAEVKVHHHARIFGKSKYGLSRTFKVLSDLLTIKTLISFCERPLLCFGILALVSFSACAGSVALAMGKLIFFPGTPLIILFGISMSFFSLGVFLLFCGALGELVYRTSNLRAKDLSFITAKDISAREQA